MLVLHAHVTVSAIHHLSTAMLVLQDVRSTSQQTAWACHQISTATLNQHACMFAPQVAAKSAAGRASSARAVASSRGAAEPQQAPARQKVTQPTVS